MTIRKVEAPPNRTPYLGAYLPPAWYRFVHTDILICPDGLGQFVRFEPGTGYGDSYYYQFSRARLLQMRNPRYVGGDDIDLIDYLLEHYPYDPTIPEVVAIKGVQEFSALLLLPRDAPSEVVDPLFEVISKKAGTTAPRVATVYYTENGVYER
jgi:hypothetical protein